MRSLDNSVHRAAWRNRIGGFVDGPLVGRFIVGLILVNAIVLGLETSPTVMGAIGGVLVAINHAIVAVFVAEILLK